MKGNFSGRELWLMVLQKEQDEDNLVVPRERGARRNHESISWCLTDEGGMSKAERVSWCLKVEGETGEDSELATGGGPTG